MKVYCVSSLESPHRGDSNEDTKYTIFNIKQKINLNYPKSAGMGFFLGSQERVRNSRGKRAISVRATEAFCLVSLVILKRVSELPYLFGYKKVFFPLYSDPKILYQ